LLPHELPSFHFGEHNDKTCVLVVIFIASEDVLLLPFQVIFLENALTSLASAGSEEHSLHVKDVRF